MAKLVSMLLVLLVLGGCGNAFKGSYEQTISNENLAYLQKNRANMFLSNNEPRIIRIDIGDENGYKSEEMAKVSKSLIGSGCIELGFSGFRGEEYEHSGYDLVSFAKKLRAPVVVYGMRVLWKDNVSGIKSVPNIQTTYSSGNASAYGSGGYASGQYSGSSTTYGTSYVPYSGVQRTFHSVAIYFLCEQ